MFNVSDIKATTLKVVPKSNFFFAQPGEGYYHRKSSLRKTLGWYACLWMDCLFTLTSYHYLTTYFIVLEDLENQFEVKSYINQFDNSILKQ